MTGLRWRSLAMADLGVIEEDVVFDWGKATALSDELRSAADVLEVQIAERHRIRSLARALWQGRFGDEFDARVSTCVSDADRFVASLRSAADGVDELARLARQEQDRREAAREWMAAQDDDGGGLFGGVPVLGEVEDTVRDGLDAVHDTFAGAETPPELEPVEPPSIPIGEPQPVTREAPPATPVPAAGSGGVSSANPADLDAWVSSSTALDDTVTLRNGGLEDAHGDFTATCRWGSFDASSLLTAVGTWVSYNRTDTSWVSTISQTFREADSGGGAGGVVTVPDAVIGARLDAAGLDTGRVSVTYDEPIVWGEPPTSGYAMDPVNTASGNFVETEVDLAAGGLLRVLRFARTYNSRAVSTGVAGADGAGAGPFGPGWASWASCRLRPEPGGAHWIGPDGQQALIPRAAPDGAGNDGFVRVVGVPGLVSWAGEDEGPGGLVMTGFGGGRFVFDDAGLPLRADEGPGTEVRFTHDDHGRLVEMRHAGGKALRLEWDTGAERIVGLSCSDGRRVTYRYDDQGRLVEVDGGPRGRRRYDHDDRSRVVVVTDADGVVEVRNTYDDEGRVVAQASPFGRRSRFRYLVGRVTIVDDDAAGPVNSYVHDEAGRLVGLVDGHGNELRKAYDRWGNPTRVVERDGSTTVLEWDDRSRLVRRQAPDGMWRHFTYDDLDRLTTVTVSTRPDVSTTRYRYAGEERIPVEVVDPEGGVTGLDVEGGLVRRIVDPDGVEVRFGFDTDGELTSVTDAAGNTAVIERDPAGRVVATVSPGGGRTELVYDDAGRPVERRDPGGGVWRFEWSPAGRLRAVVDPAGGRREQRYGAHGQVEELVDELGHVTSRRFDALGNVVGVVLPDGAKWEYSYDRLCRLVGVNDPAGASWLQEYDVTGHLVTAVDPLGGQRRATYDPAGRVTGVHDGLTSVGFDLDPLGRPAVRRRPDGTEARATYDRCGRIVAVADPAGGVTRYTSTPAGRLAAVTSPLGHVTRYEHDRCGRAVAVVDPLGNRWSYRYDADFRVTQVVAPTGEITRLRYDEDGRLAARVSPGGGITRYAYDPAGRLVAVTSPTGGVTRFAWDLAGRLVQAVDANGGVTRYERDERGLVRAMIDPLGGRVEHRYDPVGRLVERVDQLGRATHWEHDAAGRLVRRVLPTGERVRWWYDGSGRVRAVGRWVGAGGHDSEDPLVEVERDPLGRPTTVTEPGYRHELAWDPRDRLTARARNGQGLRWRYDDDGRRVAIGYPDGTETTFDRDPAGRPVAAHHPTLGEVRFQHDAAGRLIALTTAASTRRWHHTNGLLATYETERRAARSAPDGGPAGAAPVGQAHQAVEQPRPPAGRGAGAAGTAPEVEGVEGAGAAGGRGVGAAGKEREVETAERRPPVGGRGADPARAEQAEDAGESIERHVAELERDEAGRIVAATVDGVATRYGYDPAGQLVAVTGPGGAWRFHYDPAGRLVAETGPDGRDVRSTYDAAHQLVERRGAPRSGGAQPMIVSPARPEPGGPADVTRFAYDDAGRRILETAPDGSTRRYRWDWLGRPAGIDATALRVDAFGDLAEAGGTPLLWDPTEAVPQLRQIGDTIVLGHHHPWATVTGPAITWLTPDWQGTLLVPGRLATPHALPTTGVDPWGAVLDGPATGLFELGYRGELGVDGVLWLRNRVYDPGARAFLSTDPLPGVPGRPGSGHPYHYAGNDPVNALDPLGLRPLTEAQFDAYREATANSGLLDRAGDVVEAAGDWVADNWEYIAVGGVLVAATVIGGPVGTAMVGGMLLSGGLSAGAQYVLTGQVRWDQVAIDAAIGGAAGGAGAWVGGATSTWSATARVGTRLAASTATDVGGGMVARWGQGQNPFDAQGMAVDTLTGAASGGLGEGLDALRGPIRPKTVTIAPLPAGTLGATDRFGNVTIQPGLPPDVFEETLRHERVHSLLSPTQGTILADTRANVMGGLYGHSHLYRYAEEALAEGYGTRSLRNGLRFPFQGTYGVAPRRMAVEGAGVAGVGAGGYGAYEAIAGD